MLEPFIRLKLNTSLLSHMDLSPSEYEQLLSILLHCGDLGKYLAYSAHTHKAQRITMGDTITGSCKYLHINVGSRQPPPYLQATAFTVKLLDYVSLPPPPFLSSRFSLILSIRSWCRWSASCARDRPVVTPLAAAPSPVAAVVAAAAAPDEEELSDAPRVFSPNHPLLAPLLLELCPVDALVDNAFSVAPVPLAPPAGEASGPGFLELATVEFAEVAVPPAPPPPPPPPPLAEKREVRVIGDASDRCLTLGREEPEAWEAPPADEVDELELTRCGRTRRPVGDGGRWREEAGPAVSSDTPKCRAPGHQIEGTEWRAWREGRGKK